MKSLERNFIHFTNLVIKIGNLDTQPKIQVLLLPIGVGKYEEDITECFFSH